MSSQIRILFADDDDTYRIDISKDLEKKGFYVEQATSSVELREKAETQVFDIIILDLQMLDNWGRYSVIAGIENLKFLKYEKALSTPVIILSQIDDNRIVTETMRFGAFEYLLKDKVSKKRKVLFDTLNGASAQVLAEKGRKEKEAEESVGSVEVKPHLQFAVVPTGIYRQFDVGEFPQELVKYAITNKTGQDVKVSISTRIERYSDVASTNVRVKSGKVEYVSHSPVLILDEVNKIKDIEDATILHSFSFRVGGQERVEEIESEKVKLHPLTTMCWALQNVETYSVHNLENYIAAWVTPRSTLVEETLRMAADRHPEGYIVGYQGPEGISAQEKREIARAQVQAMYDTLKMEGKIKYIDSSKISFGEAGSEMQKVRLPDETLKSASANCIDGAVLFASLIECASMNSVIVLVPGHAFVGWETWDDSDEYDYLETTMLGDYNFTEALNGGEDAFREALENGSFDRGEAKVVNIADARDLGILPMFAR